MNPCRTALVGLLVISCALVQADVSHLYNVGDLSSNLPQGTPFWWMNDKSPFKRAILGCNGGNGCSAQSNQIAFAAQPSGFVSQQQQLDGGYELNPFLNAGSKHGSINMYLPPVREPESFPCEGQAVCVTRQGCASGFILSNQVPQSGLNRPCLVNNEVCCRIQVPVPVTTPAPVPSIPCNQPNFFCVPPQFCSNGVIQGQNNRLQSNPRCFGADVCCRYQPVVPPPTHTTPRYIPPPTTPRYVPAPTTQRPVTTTQYRGPDYIPPRTGDASNPQPEVIRRGEEDKPLQITQQACPAAMNCTEIQFCDATGVISKTPVVLTRQQETFRVPMTDCRDVRRNFVGKCCRDPDYVDPWPATILGQYNREIIGALFDDGSYKPPQGGFQQTAQKSQTNQVTVQRQQNTQSRFPDLVGSASGTCGVRNENSVPRGAGQFDTGFGEFTWQAMVLMQSNKSLLCGGAIIDENTIATSAHCVQGVNPRDLKVKCGEWKLGVDDEPKPFQITGVRAVSFHPAYNPANFNNDLALLHCDERIRYDQHVGPICLEDQFGSASSDNCETTGWGKDVLRIHLKGAIMNRVPVQELSQNECSSALSGYGYNPQSSTCCRPKGGDACLADVGSALACKMPSGQYLLRGIYSTETECGSPSQIVSFAKIDTQWVRQALRNPGAGNGGGHGQASQTITQTIVTNRHEVLAQPTNPHVYSVLSQAPLYLPPL